MGVGKFIESLSEYTVVSDCNKVYTDLNFLQLGILKAG